jgi:hypothetical protein
MKLLKEDIEDFEVITESTSSGNKNYFIQGPFMQFGVQNRNGRLYNENVMVPAVQKYIDELVSKNRAVGTLGHEDSPKISENKISHIITELKIINDGNGIGNIWGKAKVLETSSGKELKALIDGGVSFGCSSRALGSLKEENGIKVVQNDFTISCIDAVLQPSGISCWVDGIMEDADWVFVNGQGWVQQYREETKKTLQKTKSKDIEAVALRIWENYINKL